MERSWERSAFPGWPAIRIRSAPRPARTVSTRTGRLVRLVEVRQEHDVARGLPSSEQELFAVTAPGEAIDAAFGEAGDLALRSAGEGLLPQVGDTVARHRELDGFGVRRPAQAAPSDGQVEGLRGCVAYNGNDGKLRDGNGVALLVAVSEPLAVRRNQRHFRIVWNVGDLGCGSAAHRNAEVAGSGRKQNPG